MSPSVHRRSPKRRGSSESESPVRGRGSPRRRSPPRRERSPARRRSSPRIRSPVRTSSSQRARSPTREKEKSSSHGRSPKYEKQSSPVSRSPSPRTKRLRRAQAKLEVDRVGDREREHKRNSSREGDKERHRERGGDREDHSDRSQRRSARENNNGGSSRSRHKQSTSPVDRGHRNRNSSRSPTRDSRTRAHDEVPNPGEAEHRGDGDNDSVTKMKATEEALEANQKQKPSFELSGKLAAETNRVKGVTLLFTEPSDARKPDARWRLYVFKGGEVLNEPLYIHRQSCYLFGRERRVADIPTDHPSCSKQHAVIQFRQVEKEQPDGMLKKQVRPYLMDLGSTNGTFINDNRIEPQRYYELIEKDTIKFVLNSFSMGSYKPRVCNLARELSRVTGFSVIFGSLELPCHNFIFLWLMQDALTIFCLDKSRYYLRLSVASKKTLAICGILFVCFVGEVVFLEFISSVLGPDVGQDVGILFPRWSQGWHPPTSTVNLRTKPYSFTYVNRGTGIEIPKH
ncbi:Forkhead-associated (FHA) domain [Macleaya cordata]|uniref:Forkhead-associated (FHA) domain n=1 Tax=Macleaya cordata TaxID=56857 RepID=A0A200R1R8_MACCD|nr:Forkhead-associated (FHA) domain [Macleaya cordata]